MADNIAVTEGSGKTVATDDISGIQFQRVKLTLGADGVNDGDISSSNPIPATVSGVATATKQDSQTALLTTIDADTGNIATSVAGLLTDTQLRATPVPVSGTVTANLGTIAGVATEATVVKNTDFSMFRNAALSNTAVAVKAAAGTLAGCHIYNPNSSESFVQFYNVAQGSVTVGTTTPDYTLFIPAFGAVDGGILPIAFSTAITVAATTTIGGGTAPSTALLVNLQYK